MSSFGRNTLYIGRLIAYGVSVSLWWIWWRSGLRALVMAAFPFVALAVSDRAMSKDYRERLSANPKHEIDLQNALTPLMKKQYDHIWNMVSAVSDREWDRRQTLEDKGRHFVDRISIEVAIVGTLLAFFGFTAAALPKLGLLGFKGVLMAAALLYYLMAYGLATLSLRVGVIHLVQPREFSAMLQTGQAQTLEILNISQVLAATELNAVVNDRKAQYITAADECKRNAVVLLLVVAVVIVGERTVSEWHLRKNDVSTSAGIAGPSLTESSK